jgi:hypothetical protein
MDSKGQTARKTMARKLSVLAGIAFALLALGSAFYFWTQVAQSFYLNEQTIVEAS